MSQHNLQHYYFSHLRRGQGSMSDASSFDNGLKRLQTEVKVRLRATGINGQVLKDTNGNALDEEVLQRVALYGPGDVLGFDARKVMVRTQPAVGDGNFLANDLPFVEFSQPDFLWRYSTAKVDGHWIPWLSMIILKPRDKNEVHEFVPVENTNPTVPPRIRLTKAAVLPDLTASWRWAHLHCIDNALQNYEAIKTKVLSQPGFAISRLICPRQLKPGTKYCAFIVPTYKLGLEAALGVPSNTATGLEDLSWNFNDPTSDVEIPYYFKWEFHTGSGADFEQVLRRIQARPIAQLTGQTIDCGKPGYGLDFSESKGGGTMELEGALQASNENDSPDNPLQIPEIKQLAKLLNSAVDENGTLRVVPAIYGRWVNNAASTEVKLNVQHAKTHWLEMLNLDIRYRIAAGLGAKYVRDHQEELMEEAWKQIGKVKAANKKLSLGRFGRAISNRLHKRMTSSQEGLFELAGAANTSFVLEELGEEVSQTTFQKSTLQHKLRGSKMPNTVNSLKARKYFVHRKNSNRNKINRKGLLDGRFQVGELVLPEAQSGGLSPASQQVIQPKNRGEVLHGIDVESTIRQVAQKLLPKHTIERRFARRIAKLRAWESKCLKGQFKGSKNYKKQTDVLRPIMAYPEFHVPMYAYLMELSEAYLLPGVEQIPQNSVAALLSNRKFIEAFMVGLNHEFAAELRWREYPTDLRGSYFRKFWDTTIYAVDQRERQAFRKHPIGQELKTRLNLDWPSIEKSVNHPDQLDIANQYENAIERWLLTREEDKDIAALYNPEAHIWRKASPLGQHAVNGNSKDDNELVLVIRADILQKFPNTLVYLAQKGEDDSFTPLSQAKPIYPIYEAHLPPDILCLGFPMNETKARRHFIVFEERQSEQRFSLDVEVEEGDGFTLENLSWKHFEDLEPEGYLNDLMPNNNIAEEKWNNAAFVPKALSQKPVRMAMDLDTLLR